MGKKQASSKLLELEAKLAKYKAIFLEKKKQFRGIKHEDSLSELRYSQFMVYKSMVEGLENEVALLKSQLKGNGGGGN